MYKEFFLDNLRCSSCVKKVEDHALHYPGIKLAKLNFALKKLSLSLEGSFDEKAYLDELKAMGYGLVPEESAFDFSFLRLCLSFLFCLPFFFSLFLMLLGKPFHLAASFQVVLASFSQLSAGYVFYRGAYFSLRSGLNMDTLVALGSGSAYFYSLFAYFLDPAALLYFDTSSFIFFFVLLGKFVEERSCEQAATALRSLRSLQAKTALVERDGVFEELELAFLKKGDIFYLKAASRVALDAEVLEGQAHLDESALTGESKPILKEVGDEVFAASMSLDGFLKLRVTKTEQESLFGKIASTVEDLQSNKPKIQQFVDKLAALFVPFILVLALLTFLAWGFLADNFSQGFLSALAVLLIACPCALGLATPISILVASSRAAKKGLLFQNVEAIEKAAKIDCLFVDKTGTLTEGKLRIEHAEFFHEEEKFCWSLLYSLESRASHPIAKAIVAQAKKEGALLLELEDFHTELAKGIFGTYEKKSYAVLSESAVENAFNYPVPNGLEDMSRVFLLCEEQVLAILYLEDSLREDSYEAAYNLAQEGIELVIVSGDQERAVARVAKELGIKKYHFALKPEDKLRLLEECRAQSKSVAMFGDGVNDAAALVAADLSLSLPGTCDLALHLADISCMKGGLGSAREALILAKKTFSKIKQNLFLAFLYNLAAVPIAALGYLRPEIACAAMVASSLSLVANALRLR